MGKMLGKKLYSNGQPVYELSNNRLTYFFKNGQVKAEGAYVDEFMECEWKFYRESGQLWQVGNFSHGSKDGSWTRYDRDGNVEYAEVFQDGKQVKSK